MEVAVADFVSHTGSEPGLARDILQSANWDIHAAYNIFNTLRDQSKTTGFATKRDSSVTTAYFDVFDNPKLKGNLVSKRVEDSVDDRLEKDFRFPPPSLAVDHDFAPEEERAPSPREDPPSPINDSRCVDCIKADNVVNENAHSLQDWIISNCPHIEGFHPANLITPPSSYNGCYFDDYLRDNKKYLAPSNRQPKLQLPQQQQQRTKLGSDARSPIRLADFDPMKTDFSGKVVNGHSKCESPSLVTRLSPSQVVTGSLRHEGPESVERNDDNPFDPESKGNSQKAQFKPELNRDDEPPKEGKYGSAPCVSGFGVMSGTSSASSSVAPVSDAAIDSPVSDGEAEKAAPVVDRLNGTLTRKFARGISAIADNRPLVFQARFQVMRDIQEDEASNSQYFVETPHYSFMLPDLRSYPVDFQQFLRKDLVETSSLVSLENAGRLNWWVEKGAGQTLLPLATSGDGNCLLHAASLGMWGFHDRLLTLRKALHHTLTSSSSKGALWRRWRWNQTLQNKQIHLVYSDAIWEEEWDGLVKLSSTTPRSKPESSSSSANKGTSPKLMGGGGSAAASLSTSSVHNTSNSSNTAPSDPVSATAVVDSGATKGVAANADHGAVENSETSTSAATAKTTTTKENDSTFYESLEEFHVFVLAHVLRRPIIVVADTMLKDSNGDPFQPIHFGGVYLPLECPPSTCKRSPLVLSYDAAHFSAVVAMEGHAPHDPADESRKLLPVVVPLVAPDFNLLPLHFAVDPGEDFDWEKETKNPKIAKKLVLSTKEKLDLLLKYLDIVRIPLPKSAKTGTLNKKTPNVVATKQAESEKFVSNSIWGNDEKSAYGQVDFDSTQNGRDKDQELQVNGFDEPDRVHYESSPSTAASETSRIVKDLVVNPLPIAPTAASSSTLPPVYPHRNSSSSSSTSSNHLRSNLLVTGLGSIGRSVTKKIKRNFGGIIGSGSSRSSGGGKKSTPVTTPTNGVDVEATSEEVKKWHDVATVERRKEGIDETDNASGQPKTTKQKQTILDFRRRRSSSAERKLPSSVFGCTQVPDDDVDCHRTDAYHCANAAGSGGAAGGGEGKGDEAKVGEVTFIKKASPLGHRRLQSADANCGILAVKEESANYGSGAKTLPKSMAAGVESRNRKIGAALRNPFSTLERQKSKGEMKPPPAPSLSPNSIGDPNFLVAAKFCTNKRHEYQNEMLQNYLQNVRERFEEDKRSANKSGALAGNATLRKNPRDVESTTITTDGESTVPILRQGQASSLQTGAETTVDSVSKRLEPSPTSSATITSVESATKPPPSSFSSSSAGNRVQCITNNCTSYGSSASSYLCNTCFTKHKEEAVSLEKDIQLRGSNSRLNSPVKRQPLTATANSTSSALPKRTGSSSNLLNVKNSNNATFSSLPRRK